MPVDLPDPVAAYFEADKRDADALAQCFAETAIVIDEGHTHRGRAAIRQWKSESSAKYNYTSEPIAVESRDGATIVTGHVVGNFPGSPVDLRYAFTLKAGKIASLEITA